MPSAVLGIILVAGLYLLYRDQASTLSLVAAAISVIGYLLFVVGSLMKITFPSPVISIADISIYIVGLGMFSWLAYRTHKMPRLLAIVGFLAAVFGVASYVLVVSTSASMANPTPVLTAIYMLYLLGVVVWLVWTGVSLLRFKPAAAQAQTSAPAVS